MNRVLWGKVLGFFFFFFFFFLFLFPWVGTGVEDGPAARSLIAHGDDVTMVWLDGKMMKSSSEF